MDIDNADFNRNFSPSEFEAEKSPQNVMQSYDYNSLKMENCDTKYNQYLKSVKSSQEESKPQKNRNGLIANFDHNVLFDSLKNNNINNNNNNNYDTLFNTGIDNQMDFESIIPYSSEFQITGGNFEEMSCEDLNF